MEIRNAIKEGKFNNSTIQNRTKPPNDTPNVRTEELESITNSTSTRACDALITRRTMADKKSERRRPSGQEFDLDASCTSAFDDLDSTINALDEFDEDELLRFADDLSRSNEVGYSSEEPDGSHVTPVERRTPVDGSLADSDDVFTSSSVDESRV